MKSRSEGIKKEFEWIDLAIQYDEYMSSRTAEHKEIEKEPETEEKQDDYEKDMEWEKGGLNTKRKGGLYFV